MSLNSLFRRSTCTQISQYHKTTNNDYVYLISFSIVNDLDQEYSLLIMSIFAG